MDKRAEYTTAAAAKPEETLADKLVRGEPVTWRGEVRFSDRWPEAERDANLRIMREMLYTLGDVLLPGRSYQIFFDKQIESPPKGSFEALDGRRKMVLGLRVQRTETTRLERPAPPDYAAMSSKQLVATAWAEIRRRFWRDAHLRYWRMRRPLDNGLARLGMYWRWSRLAGWMRDQRLAARRGFAWAGGEIRFFFSFNRMRIRIWWRRLWK